MKKIFLYFLTFGYFSTYAQKTNDCGTTPKGPLVMFSQKQINDLKSVSAINTPYCVKVFITVFANDNGSFRADNNANILTNFQYMVNAFQPHNICFMLAGIKQVNNTDLNYQDIDTEQAELSPFIQAGFLNVFIHDTIPGANGSAYDIPNPYLSLNGSSYNIATMGHEMGHSLGLYHTFHGSNENVARTGACKNCETMGDLLCDTPADDNGGVNGLCIYTGTAKDACSTPTQYTPLTNNMMAYGNFICRNSFTSGQGERIRLTIANNATINNLMAQDILYMPVFSNLTISSGTNYNLARDLFVVSDGSTNLTVNGTANQFFQAKKVTLKPGTKFSPSSGGKVSIKSNPYCN